MKNNVRRMIKGFTLIELLVVVLIIGILAAIAVPQYMKTVEMGRAAEGVAILGALRGAQKAYYARNSYYYNGVSWNKPGDLAVEFDPPNPKYFWYIPMGLTSTSCSGASIARVQRNTTQNSSYGYYMLCIRPDGTITCTNGNNTNQICPVLGY